MFTEYVASREKRPQHGRRSDEGSSIIDIAAKHILDGDGGENSIFSPSHLRCPSHSSQLLLLKRLSIHHQPFILSRTNAQCIIRFFQFQEVLSSTISTPLSRHSLHVIRICKPHDLGGR